MFGVLQTLTTQKLAILTASLIGLASCLAAVLDMRSQVADERSSLPPTVRDHAAQQDIHRMRGWPLHQGHDPVPAQRVDTGSRGLG